MAPLPVYKLLSAHKTVAPSMQTNLSYKQHLILNERNYGNYALEPAPLTPDLASIMIFPSFIKSPCGVKKVRNIFVDIII